MKSAKFKMQDLKNKFDAWLKPVPALKLPLLLSASAFMFLLVASFVSAQTETPPPASAPKSVSVPPVKEAKLPNGLTVATVERKNVPLVTVQLVVKGGASLEAANKAGLADLTAGLLTKGTKMRTATQIAEEIEFLGGMINTSAAWNSSSVSVNVMSDKLERALAVMSDVVLNPVFKQQEIDLLKSQTLDALNVNLKQPSFLGGYAAVKYTFGEHPAGGTPNTLKAIARNDIVNFHRRNFRPENSVLIFTGDITASVAQAYAAKYFGKWKMPVMGTGTGMGGAVSRNYGTGIRTPVVGRILVVDLPNAGQASVTYAKNLMRVGRIGNGFYPASVLNSLLGGGYSARLNQEIRIKRGLSYGAGSNFDWRKASSNFAAATQTKNESAAEVAELVAAEIKRLADSPIAEDELNPRKLVLTGSFSRGMETTGGIAARVASLYTYGLPTAELNTFMSSVQSVSEKQIRDFAGANLLGGDLIIVGDYKIFKDDLAKRFPNRKIEIVPASELDLGSASLRKTKR